MKMNKICEKFAPKSIKSEEKFVFPSNGRQSDSKDDLSIVVKCFGEDGETSKDYEFLIHSKYKAPIFKSGGTKDCVKMEKSKEEKTRKIDGGDKEQKSGAVKSRSFTSKIPVPVRPKVGARKSRENVDPNPVASKVDVQKSKSGDVVVSDRAKKSAQKSKSTDVVVPVSKNVDIQKSKSRNVVVPDRANKNTQKSKSTDVLVRERARVDAQKSKSRDVAVRTKSEEPKKATKTGNVKVNCSQATPLHSNGVDMSKLVQNLLSDDWETCVKGLKELQEVCDTVCWEDYESFVPTINRKLIDCIVSPRSMLCRTSCQAAGDYLKTVKCTKKPEFDVIVETLLGKTADMNKFIQKNASIALEKIVTGINPADSIRTLLTHAPVHKNNLVRVVTAKMLLKVCSTFKVDLILGSNVPVKSTKLVYKTIASFLEDKSIEVRKTTESCVKLLKGHKNFTKDLLKEVPSNAKGKIIKLIGAIN